MAELARPTAFERRLTPKPEGLARYAKMGEELSAS